MVKKELLKIIQLIFIVFNMQNEKTAIQNIILKFNKCFTKKKISSKTLFKKNQISYEYYKHV